MTHRRRFLSLAAAILLVSGVFSAVFSAVAGEPADEGTRRETIYTLDGTVAEGKTALDRYFFGPAGSRPRTIRLLRYDSISGEEIVWDSYSSGFRPGANESPSAGAELRPYDLSVAFDDGVMDRLGLAGRTGDESDPEAAPTQPEPSSADAQLPDNNGIYTFLAFDKRAYLSGTNRGRILSGGVYNDEFGKAEAEFTNPFSIPLALLFVALCAGILLIIYTTTGEKIKDMTSVGP